MPSRAKKTIEQQLNSAQVAIDNALNNRDVRALLAEFAYDNVRLQAGRTLYEAALAANQAQNSTYGDQFSASATHHAAWRKADTSYMRLVKVARIALRNDKGAAHKLGLLGERSDSFAGWMAQARQFYAGALADPALLAKLAEFGVTAAKLEAGRAEVEALELANLNQESERGTAQNATKTRDAALSALDTWMRDFIGVARVALADQPQLLEKLGVLARS